MRALVIGAWVLATVGAGSVTWAAVATFGPADGPGAKHVLSQSDIRRQLVGSTSAPLSTPTHPSQTHGPDGGPHSGPGATEPPGGGSPGNPTGSSSGPTQGPHTTSTGPPPTKPPTTSGGAPPPTHHTSPAPRPRSRSWWFDGGHAGATCKGADITAFYATPEDGWGYTVLDNGPEQLRLRFHEEESTTNVTVRCVAGVPSAQIEEDGDDGGGGDDGTPPGAATEGPTVSAER